MTSQESLHREVAAWLERPDAYPDYPRTVTTKETHISRVFLAGEHAYKLKKPVRYDFLDFSTPELRRRACAEELRLNRRLAPDVYLDLIPVTRDAVGGFRLGGEGEPLDWVVRMRRLDTEQALDRLIATGRLTPEHVRQIAAALARFYAGAPPAAVAPADYVASIERRVRANRRDLLDVKHGMQPALVRRVHGAQQQFLTIEANALAERASNGRVIEGHGDLRPEHICFDPQPVVFDCIEFSAEFRQIDAVDELCFLAVECERLGAGLVGEQILAAYEAASGDHPREQIVDFHKSYRACVRAKVAVLRGDQVSAADRQAALNEANEYLALADRHAARFGRPCVIVVGGLMGVGKSTLAAAISDKLGAELLRTDVVRQEMFGAPGSRVEFGGQRYRPENRGKVYEELFRRAEPLLCGRESVVLDGTFSTALSRQQAVDAASHSGARLLLVRCHCPADIARQRIANRLAAGGDASEARPELYDQQAAEEEPWGGAPQVCEIDTTRRLERQLEDVTACLRKALSLPLPMQNDRASGDGG